MIRITERDGVLHGVVDHPPANALDADLVAALVDLMRRFERGRAAVLVLSSALPGCFAEGPPAELESASAEELADFHDEVRRPLERLASCRRPSIAAIDGRATGLGLELAMACTLRTCSPSSRFALPEAHLGYLPGAGGTQRLPRLVGPSRALDMLLTGRMVGADEALRIGLVDRLYYRNVIEESFAVAQAMASVPSPGAAMIIGCVEAALDLPVEEGISVERAALVSLIEDGAIQRHR